MSNLRNRLIYIDIFTDMYLVLIKIGDIFRAESYLNAVNKIKNNELLSDSFKEKMKIIDRNYKKTGIKNMYPELKKLLVLSKLIDIPGFGKKTILGYSKENFDIKTLIKNKSLTNYQKIGLKYYKRIFRNLNRDTIEFIIDRINRILKRESLPSALGVGSYRRGKEYNIGDIDLLIKSDEVSGTGSIDIINAIKTKLKYDSINYIDTFVEGEKRFSFLMKYKNKRLKDTYNIMYEDHEYKDYIYIQVDVRFTDEKSYPFALLYFTGSKTFNIIIRKKAIEMGLKLNEYGLYDSDGKEIDNLNSEEDIINYLGMDEKYYDPINRNK